MSDRLESIEQAARRKELSASAVANLKRWFTVNHYAPFRPEIERLIDARQWETLNDCFYQLIPFGTGGRRGPVGVGPNRMNEATVAESAQGLANKLLKTIAGRRPRVAVAYDTRLSSPAFTLCAAKVFAGNGIEVCLFDGPRATPELSFMIRDLKCDAGVVISASHNPPEDNGFKAYWSDGGQIVPPLDGELIEEVKAVEVVREISFEEAYGRGLIRRLAPEDDRRYQQAVAARALTDCRQVKIVYSPLHGTGLTSVAPVLRAAGFADIHLVESQKDPDGRFPNVPGHKPNPEVTTGLDAAIALAKAIQADIAMVSDPDADRLACAVSDGKGGFALLSGNQSAALMMEFIGREMQASGSLKPSHRVYTTCVSSPLFPTIARAYGLTVKDDLLVGFKWIAEQIEKQADPEDFLFGSEESIGFMRGPQSRDKDAAAAALLMAEIAARQKAAGRTLLAFLDDIYRRYGYFHDAGASIFLEGAKGSERMARIMAALRQSPPAEVAGLPVLAVIDRMTNRIRGLDGTSLGTVDGPTSNLLIFRLREDHKSWIALRPSGTEPKIKFYLSLYAPATGDLAATRTATAALAERMVKTLADTAMAIP
ncbi:MAG: phospho-sugar mutase [Myxococcales bacterium]|nr:MAG: phospho-sugar mutase [Myxococcales bacterium]